MVVASRLSSAFALIAVFSSSVLFPVVASNQNLRRGDAGGFPVRMRNDLSRIEVDADDEDPEVEDAIGNDSEDDEAADGDKTELLKSAQSAHTDLSANLEKQKGLQMALRNIDNWADMPQRVQAMANETQSPALASLIHDMLLDARMFAKPVYEEYLKDKLAKLQGDRPDLEAMFHLSTAEVKDSKL